MDESGYRWSGDPKHTRILIKELDLENANGTSVPLGPEEKPTTSIATDNEPVYMNEVNAKGYRRCAARINYMALDRPDLGFAANLLSRHMAKPRLGDEVALKKVVRYLVSHPVCELVYYWQPMPSGITILMDSD